MALPLPAGLGWSGLAPSLSDVPLPTHGLLRLAGWEEAMPGDLCILSARISPLQIRVCQASVLVGTADQKRHWVQAAGRWFVEVPSPPKVFWEILNGPCRPQEDPDDWLSASEAVQRFGKGADRASIHRSVQAEAGVKVLPGAVIHARVFLGSGVQVGEGSVLGADGFGLVQVDGQLTPLPHWAGVRIGAGTRIGPQCQVSAGLLVPTTIGVACHLDSQVQVGHNCHIGDRSVLAGQVGLSGSVRLGRGCLVGGQAGFADHVELGEGCLVAARAGVTRSYPGGTVLRGFPARPGRKGLLI